MISLDIISDVACPWCYVGKAYLDRALAAHPQHPLHIEWHPFQLNPDLPPEGMDRLAYLTAKFGGRDGILRAHAPLLEHAERAGIALDMPAITRTPNTLDAHRLVHWAGLEGRQTAMVSALFRAYWRDGRDIGDQVVLADIASEIGLDRALIARLLHSNADRGDVLARDAHARERGVTAVPTYILANHYVLQGAQPVEIWSSIIAELIENAQ